MSPLSVNHSFAFPLLGIEFLLLASLAFPSIKSIVYCLLSILLFVRQGTASRASYKDVHCCLLAAILFSRSFRYSNYFLFILSRGISRSLTKKNIESAGRNEAYKTEQNAHPHGLEGVDHPPRNHHQCPFLDRTTHGHQP